MFLAVGSSVTSRRSQRERLAFKLYDIGKTVLKDQVGAEDGKASLAIVWLQKAFSIADQLEGPSTAAIADLKARVVFFTPNAG